MSNLDGWFVWGYSGANRMVEILQVACPVALLVYYAAAILRTHQVREPKSVVIQYESPEGISPALGRYIWKGTVDQRTIATVFASLVVKGAIRISPNGGTYHVTRVQNASAKARNKEEQLMMDWLFSNFLTETEFHPTRSSQGCMDAITAVVHKQAGSLYRATSYGYVVFGVMISLIAALALAGSGPVHDRGGAYILTWACYMCVPLAVAVTWVTFVAAIVDLAKGIGSFGRVVFGAAMTGFVGASLVAVSMKLEAAASVGLLASVLAMSGMNSMAGFFLKSITSQGAELQAKLEGFREFLAKVEQDRLNRQNAAGEELKSNEKSLAYAIALEVKEEWGDELVNACMPRVAG